ncbi:MAG: toxic anion resistance protein [Epsilonproteobacteria bacterium]|nr:toxic anion resistance protein [Campylobacterota bacterium]
MMEQEKKDSVVPMSMDEIAKEITAQKSSSDLSKEEVKKEIDIHDINSVILYGSKVQENIEKISNNMLEGVKNKDIGEVGETLSRMVSAIKNFDVDELNPNEKPSFWERLFGKESKIQKFIQGYEEVRKQVEQIANQLEQHKTQLLTDIESLDRLYDANLKFFYDLEVYIAAGDEKLKELDEVLIPKLEKEAKESGDMLKAQQLRDLRSVRDDLERRIHDLRLTRQVAMQSLPSIRLIQENDKGLINKINSTLVNTIPLWKNQLAQTVTIYRSRQAAGKLKEATDLTNELLEKNAENLKLANEEIRRQVERGVFDIETIKKANQTLIDTINESLQITEEAKKAREHAKKELELIENELKSALIAAKNKKEAIERKSK